jgi:hypothetical protein
MTADFPNRSCCAQQSAQLRVPNRLYLKRVRSRRPPRLMGERSPTRGVAMPMQMIVGPARAATDRRPPERLTENAADHAAGDGADRTGDDQAGSRSRAGADPIGARVRRRKRRGGKHSCGQNEVPHLPVPQQRLTALTPQRSRTSVRQEPNKTISQIRGKRRADFWPHSRLHTPQALSSVYDYAAIDLFDAVDAG